MWKTAAVRFYKALAFLMIAGLFVPLTTMALSHGGSNADIRRNCPTKNWCDYHPAIIDKAWRHSHLDRITKGSGSVNLHSAPLAAHGNVYLPAHSASTSALWKKMNGATGHRTWSFVPSGGFETHTHVPAFSDYSMPPEAASRVGTWLNNAINLDVAFHVGLGKDPIKDDLEEELKNILIATDCEAVGAPVTAAALTADLLGAPALTGFDVLGMVSGMEHNAAAHSWPIAETAPNAPRAPVKPEVKELIERGAVYCGTVAGGLLGALFGFVSPAPGGLITGSRVGIALGAATGAFIGKFVGDSLESHVSDGFREAPTQQQE